MNDDRRREILYAVSRLGELQAEHGEMKGTLVFLGFPPEELDEYGGFDE